MPVTIEVNDGKIISAVDAAVLKKLDLLTICYDLVLRAISTDIQFRRKYYSLEGEARQRFIANWLANKHGLSNIESAQLKNC